MGKTVLVLCTGNSCRSQMAHGFLKTYAAEGTQVYSAGVETHGVNPKAIQAMKEVGIDISTHTSNNVDEYTNIDFDYIITVCDSARERCPYFPSSAIKFHHSFPDPFGATGTSEEVAAVFNDVRDQIKVYCKEFASAYLR
ncbi:MAG: arsenate reductase ArsC [bacterium]|nr:arsenate reductase ArsC [bacterium]